MILLGDFFFIFVQSLRQDLQVEILFLGPYWTEICLVSDNYHPPTLTPRIVMNRQPRKLKFGMEALFDQTRSTS